MLLILAIILALFWLGGFTVFHVTSAAIHLLILAAIVALVLHFVTGMRTRGPAL
jgi:hypothetical protein